MSDQVPAAPTVDRVVVLAGGLSYEREVSLRSGAKLAEALGDAGVEVQVRDADAGLLGALAADPPDVVWPVLHGASGEDGAIREVLALTGVPYVGAGPGACRIAFDKPVAKTVVADRSVATPDSVTLRSETFHDLGAPAVLDAVLARLGLPLFVKPARGGSALGAGKVTTAAELPAAMLACFAYGDTALIERFVPGTEVTVTVVDTGSGPVPLPAVEIVPLEGVYDYAARYTAGRTEFFCPARLPAEVGRAVAAAAVTAHRALGLRDLSRTDLIVDPAGVPYFLEVNVAPGMTHTSALPLTVRTAGHDLGELARAIAAAAIARTRTPAGSVSR